MERSTVIGSPLPGSREGARAGDEQGYTMVALIVAVTVLSIMLAVALPQWSHWIQRQKEQELISRGLQYAQAIQVFQSRYGRLPIRLEELIEVKPRCIRQLWKDPMTEDGKWGLIFQGANGGRIAASNQNAQPGGRGRNPSRGDLATGTSPGLERRGDRDEVTIGPISGVYSRSTKDSILTFADAKQHSEWKFDTQLLASTLAVGNEQGASPAVTAVMPARWIGRPFRKGITVQMQSPNPRIPQGSGPGGNVAPGQGGAGNRQPGSPAFGTGGNGNTQPGASPNNRATGGANNGRQPRSGFGQRGNGRRP